MTSLNPENFSTRWVTFGEVLVWAGSEHSQRLPWKVHWCFLRQPRIFLTDYKQYDAETLLEHADRSHHESLQMVLNAGVEIIPLRGRLPTGALEFPHVPHSQDVLQKHVCSNSCLKKLKHRPRHRKTRSAHFKRLWGLCGHSGSILQRVCFFYRKYKPKYPACVSSRI